MGARRFIRNKQKIYVLSVERVHIRGTTPTPFRLILYSHMSKSYSLRHGVGISIYGEEIVRVNGLVLASDFPDFNIF